MKNGQKQLYMIAALVLVIVVWSSVLTAQSLDPARQAEQILNACNIDGGLIVHIGCGDARLTAALCADKSYLVHGLDRNAKCVAQAREYLQSQGVYGNVSVDKLEGDNLLKLHRI